ncbi:MULTISPECIES: hypothetical protein [Pseudofrankia]|uniref:hypothetical protein n=1 Tax=Pseudofrankia TaxID=2994363 RepID=UPI000234D1BC|nr:MULTISPECIES: hypothetical protein [Pseudofrankia]OHV35164.1 hypothetical protein BCD49_04060 [Pseudofrankia sp. EUN1h]
MRIRAVAPAAFVLFLAVALTACSAVSESDEPATPASTSGGATSTASTTASPGTSSTSTASPGGPKPGSFTAPKSACDLVDAPSLERISGRSGLSLNSVSSLGCAVTDGFLPVGAVTLVIRTADANKSAQQELDDTVAASTYGKDKVQDIPGLGAAARYGTSSLGSMTFASVYTIDLRGTQVASLSISIDAKDPATAKDPLVVLARAALGKI